MKPSVVSQGTFTSTIICESVSFSGETLCKNTLTQKILTIINLLLGLKSAFEISAQLMAAKTDPVERPACDAMAIARNRRPVHPCHNETGKAQVSSRIGHCATACNCHDSAMLQTSAACLPDQENKFGKRGLVESK